MSNSQRSKGSRVEREIVNRHKELGVHAERVPLSGASRYRENGHDLDIYAFGVLQKPLLSEVKARGDGQGFTVLERWLAENDALFLRRDGADPLVVVPWRVWERLICASVHGAKTTSGQHALRSERHDGISDGHAPPDGGKQGNSTKAGGTNVIAE